LRKRNIHRIKPGRIFIFIICFILLNIQLADSALEVIPGWYGVEEWEIDVCTMWGGAEEAQEGYITEGGPVLLSQTTLSLQGKKIVYNIGNQSSLYEASWYLEPIGEDINYTVHIIDAEGNIIQIGSGTASLTGPAKGYYAEYHEANYTDIKLAYGDRFLQIPIVEE